MISEGTVYTCDGPCVQLPQLTPAQPGETKCTYYTDATAAYLFIAGIPVDWAGVGEIMQGAAAVIATGGFLVCHIID